MIKFFSSLRLERSKPEKHNLQAHSFFLGCRINPLGFLATMICLSAIIMASITSLLSCKVGVIIYSTLITIILPMSALMLFLSSHINSQEAQKAFNVISALSLVGYLLILASPFFASESDAVINNYIPMLDNFVFIAGFSIFLASSILACLIMGPNILRILCGIMALGLIISYRKIDTEITYPIDLHGYFEMLFLTTSSIMSILALYIAYILLVDLFSGKKHKIVEYFIAVSAICIFTSHFFYNIDSAEFLTISGLYLPYAKAIIVILVSLSTIIYIGKGKQIALLPLSLLLISILADAYYSNKGDTIESFHLLGNFGITISIMCYLAYILVDGRSYLMKSVKIQAIIYFLSSFLIIFSFVNSVGWIFISVSGILFAIFCILNIILEIQKIEEK